MSTATQRKRRNEKRQGGSVIYLQADSLPLFAQQEEGKPARFEMDPAYSGGKLFVKGFELPVVVDLRGLEVNASANILLDHQSSQRVGHPEDIANDGRSLRVTGVVSAVNDHAEEVLASHRQGFRWQASIGARVVEVRRVRDGAIVAVNGQVFRGPIILATKAVLNEISFVGSGGDEANHVSLAASSIGVKDMTFTEWCANNGWKHDELQDSQVAILQASYDSEQAEEAEKPERQEEKKEEVIMAAEATNETSTEIINDIRAEASAEKRRIAEIDKVAKGFPEICANGIEKGLTPVQVEVEVLRAEREQAEKTEGPAIHVSDGNVDGRVLEAALCMQFGMKEDVTGKYYDDKTMEAALSSQYANIGLHYLMYQSLRAAGKSYRPGIVDSTTIEDFLRAEQDLQASTAFSTTTTTGVLSSVANKRLMQSFTSVGTIATTVAETRSVSDFKTHNAYRLTASGELLLVPAGGEIKHLAPTDETFTHKAETYAAMITLSRTDMVNDDLGAFEQIPALLGRKSAIALEKAFWTLVLSNPSTYFQSGAGNDNLITGASSALSIDSLSDAEQKLLDQTDSDGDPILVTAQYLITGTALAVEAAQLMTEQRIVMESRDTTATAAATTPASNPHAGKWTPLVSPYINAQSLTGGSATQWYLAANPADVPGWTISFLNGRQTPVIESSDVDFNRLGMSWRVVFDFGVDATDGRAWVKSDGA